MLWLVTHHITNTGRHLRKGSQNGILIIPQEGKIWKPWRLWKRYTSDIKTLKLNPVPLPNKPGYYMLEQPVKPGEKYYQARVHYNYNGEPREITFDNIYPMSTKLLIILHAKNMLVQWKENPAWDTKPVFNENIGADVVTMPNQQGKFTLIFSGGTPEKAEKPNSQSTNQPIGAISPVNKYLKLGGLIAFVSILIGFFYYIKHRPAWLQMMQSKNKSRLAFEIHT
jgi:hypothetical protein